MAEDLTYADLQPIDDKSYQNLYTVVSRRNQTYGFGDVDSQVFIPAFREAENYLKENPVYDFSDPAQSNKFYAIEAPNFSKYVQLGEDTFEGKVASTAMKYLGINPATGKPYDNPYAAFYTDINSTITSGEYGELNPDSAATYRGFATNVFDEYKKAVDKEAIYDQEWWNNSSLGKKGIPDPRLNYSPKSFPKYAAWESGIKKSISQKFPREAAQYADAINAAIEQRAIAIMRGNKRTPFYDALLREEALK